jgi:hypothetical protein
MMLRFAAAAALCTLPLFAGCGNGGASEPQITSVDPGASSKLQFAVGIATIAFNGGNTVASGLNAVLTLRQSNGLSGTLYNVPQILGPSNFLVLKSTQTGDQVQASGSDLGTNHITWGTLNQQQWTGPPRGLKASTTGAFGYGFCPCNSDGGPINGTSPLYQAFMLPVYGNNEERFYGGPPAFPPIDPSLAALGFQGYSLGFTDFAVQPVLGAYSLYAAVPPAYTTPQNPTPSPNPDGTPTPPPGVLAATAQLTTLNALAPFSTPSFKPDGNGGGTISVNVPHGVSEALVVVRSIGGSGISPCAQIHTTDSFTTVLARAAGLQHLKLPDNLGPMNQDGNPSPTLCSKGGYQMYAVGADWPMYESSYPKNLTQVPPITGPRGQADVTTSDILNGSYP